MHRKIGRLEDFEDGSDELIGALIEVHRLLGPGLLESTYEACLCRELVLRGISFERQRPLAVHYKGVDVDCAYRIDLIVRGSVLLELKAVEEILPIHVAQVLTYLKLTELPLGFLVNFNVRLLRDGLRRITNKFPKSFQSSNLPVSLLPRR